MNKSELAKDVSVRTGVSIKQAIYNVDQVLEAIRVGTLKDGEVKLLGFGTFKAIDKPAREGRNPSTGLAIAIAAKTVVKFKPYF